MKRKLLAKFWGITLATAMTASLAVSGVSASENADGTGTISYPLETEDELSIWSTSTLKPVSVYMDWTESPFHTGLEKATGVKVEWNFAADGADEESVYNLLLTEDTLPDVIFKYVSAVDAQEYVESGMIYDLTEYLPEYAPDYWAYLNEHPDVMKSVQTEDGAIYGFGTFLEDDHNKTFIGPIVRQDWLDECGLEAPVTLEDWEEMLVTFKDKYGAKLAFCDSRFGNSSSLGSGVDAMATFVASWYIDDDGNVQFAQSQPEWKEYMSVLNKWWDMGLIDEDSFVMNDEDVRTKVANNEVGATVTAMSQLTNYVTDAETTGSGANWVGIEYPRTAAGEPTCMIQTNNSHSGNTAFITTDCSEEKLITALEWLNYGYSEEGRMYWNFGTEGETYTVDEQGNIAWTDLITEDADGLNMAVQKYTGALWSGISIQSSKLGGLKNVPVAAEAVEKWIDNNEADKHWMPNVSLTVDEGIEYNDLFTNITETTKTAALEFITGARAIDDFDSFVEELNDLGLEKCQELQQAAYERYLAK